MADSSAAIQSSVQARQPVFNPLFTQAALQLAQTQSLLNNNQQNRIDENGFLQPIPANADNEFITTQADFSEGLLNLNAQTLRIFNEINLEGANNNGKLTSEQLQEIAVLQADALKLEQASLLSSSLPLANSAATVDLSLEAQEIVLGNGNNLNNLAAGINSNGGLTQAQLDEIAQVVAPFINEPLTPELLLRIQAQLANSRIVNPTQLSLSTLILVQSYLAGLQPAPASVTQANAEADYEEPGRVNPVAATVKVAAEDVSII
jgi:hypothetical protein